MSRPKYRIISKPLLLREKIFRTKNAF
jgi:hypothetical protein